MGDPADRDEQAAPVANLPPHVVTLCLAKLKAPTDVLAASQVCRSWRALLTQGELARNTYARLLGEEPNGDEDAGRVRRRYLARATNLGWLRAIPTTSRIVFSVRHGAGRSNFTTLPDGLGGCRHVLAAPYAVLPHRGGCSDASDAARPPRVRIALNEVDTDGLGCADVRSRRLRAVTYEEGAPGPPSRVRAEDTLRRCVPVVLGVLTAQVNTTGDAAAVWLDGRRAATLRMAHPATVLCLFEHTHGPCLLAGGRHGFEMWSLTKATLPNADARLVVRPLVPPPAVPLFGFAPASLAVWHADGGDSGMHVAALANDGRCAVLRCHVLAPAGVAVQASAEQWLQIPTPPELDAGEDVIAAGTLRVLRDAGGAVGPGVGLLATVHRLADTSSEATRCDAPGATPMHQPPQPVDALPPAAARALQGSVVTHLVAYALEPVPRVAWHTNIQHHGALLSVDAAPPWIAAIAADGALLLLRARDGKLARCLPHPELDGVPRGGLPAGMRLPPGARLRPGSLMGAALPPGGDGSACDSGAADGSPPPAAPPVITDASVQFGPFATGFKGMDSPGADDGRQCDGGRRELGSRSLYVLLERVETALPSETGRVLSRAGASLAPPARALSITRHSVDDDVAVADLPMPPPECLCGHAAVLRWRREANGARRSFYCCAAKRRGLGRCGYVQYYA